MLKKQIVAGLVFLAFVAGSVLASEDIRKKKIRKHNLCHADCLTKCIPGTCLTHTVKIVDGECTFTCLLIDGPVEEPDTCEMETEDDECPPPLICIGDTWML